MGYQFSGIRKDSKCQDGNRKRKIHASSGHNAKNPKRNLNHNSTASRLSVRKNRIFSGVLLKEHGDIERFITLADILAYIKHEGRKIRERLLGESENLNPEFSASVDKHFWNLV